MCCEVHTLKCILHSAMKATAKDLRLRTREVLEAVERGEEVEITHRGKLKARLIPAKATRRGTPGRPRAFGMWSDHDDFDDVRAAVDRLRQGRH